MTRIVRLAGVVLLLGAALFVPRPSSAQAITYALFERYLESLRQQAGVPGLSAVILRDQEIVWEKGFGLQEVERNVAATPNTPYLIGDVSQTFAAMLALRCVEEEADVSLEDPIQRWTNEIPEANARVWQILSHVTPSGAFKYDPARYASLTPMIAYCSDHGIAKLVSDQILDRLGMFDSVPGHDLADPSAPVSQLFDQSHRDRYGRVLNNLAIPYKVDKAGKATRSEYPVKGLNAATGLVSTVRDLARYDAALDKGILLRPRRLNEAWTNTVSSNGSRSRMGLGWFVQVYNGQRLVWHFGLLRESYSSLMLKVPGRNLTLILLANSDGLSSPFLLGNGDVTTSVFAQLFLRTFVS